MNERKRIEIPLVVVGCDFRSANVKFRECLVTTPEERLALHSGISSIELEAGFVALETCNRIEWLASCENPDWVAELLSAQMIERWQKNLPGISNFPTPRIYIGRNAAKHVMRVVSGAESLATGEAQIAGQFQDAMKRAREEKTSNYILNGLAKHAGRLAKSGARIGFRSDHTRGIHSMTADYLKAYFNSDAKTKTVIVLGMGSIGRKTAEAVEHLLKCNVIRINRTVSSQHKNVWRGLNELPCLLEEADALVVATGALSPVLQTTHVKSAGSRHPILIVDIGIPNQAAPDVQSLDCVVYRNMDNLTESSTESNTDFDLSVDQEVERETDLFRRFCIERNIVTLLEETQRRRQEFMFEQIPSIVESELWQLDEESRKIVVSAMKTLISRYSYDSFNSIHSALEKYWSE